MGQLTAASLCKHSQSHWQNLFCFELLPIVQSFNEPKRFRGRLCFRLQERNAPTVVDVLDRAVLIGHQRSVNFSGYAPKNRSCTRVQTWIWSSSCLHRASMIIKHFITQLMHNIYYVGTIKIIKYLKVLQHVSDHRGSIIREPSTVLG